MAEATAAPPPDQAITSIAEFGLLAVHLAVAGGFARLYAGTSFFGDLAGFVLLAHALAVITRRRRVPVAAIVSIALIGAVVVVAWLLFPDTLRLGLPTSATATAARQALQVSREQFSVVFAPVPVTAGFQLAAGLALYLAVWFADWAAFRLRATGEALAPAAVLFLFASQLGSGRYTIASALAFAVSALGFVLAHRAWQAASDLAWLAAARFSGPRSVLRLGASLAVVGLVAGAVIGPRLPGNGQQPLLDWHSSASGTGDRSTVSPIVDLQKRLVNQSDTVLFTVKAERPAYWRLTSLDTFDGRIWRSDGNYSTAEGRLPSDGAEIGAGRRNTQRFTIRSLSAIWAPSAFEAQRVLSASADLQWDNDSSTLIIGDRSPNSDGLSYQIISEAPELDPAILERANADDRLPSRFRRLPDDFPDVARDTARAVTQDATNRYEQALALQTFFRTQFEYSLDVPPGHSDDAIVDFLANRVGYCEQFAGTYAALARSLGIPARVAVGFTPGEVDPDDPTLFTVRGRHAHAWPEVWFPDAGWVAFEPTPGRGMPDAQSYTGVGPAQDDTRPSSEVSLVPTTTSPPATSTPPTTPDGTPSTTAPEHPRVVAGAGSDGQGSDRRSAAPTWLAIGAGAILAWVLVVLTVPVLRRRHRRRGDAGPADAVLGAWDAALGPVRWQAGVRPDPAETHDEFAGRAGRADPAVAGPLQELAALATMASWNPAAPSSAQVAQAQALAGDLHRQVTERQAVTARLRRRLSWREAFATLR